MSRFIDEVQITLVSGNGGDGAVSFRREKYVPKGGPDGGDGGDGGDVIVEVKKELKTLFDLKTRNIIKAKDGKPGSGRNRKGADGRDAVVPVPPGTVLIDVASNRIIADLTAEGNFFTAVKGGRGGAGNARFATSVNRAPRYARKGKSGQSMDLKLQLKVIADIGIVGLPNAGKSTLLSVLTNARPKIAGYPFTTLVPNLGVMRFGNDREFVIADVPGLIEGASSGYGLGIQFLRHIERTKALLVLLDLFESDLEGDYKTLIEEMKQYSGKLLQKPRLIVGSKMDIVASSRAVDLFSSGIEGRKLTISSTTGSGIEKLKEEIALLMDRIDENKGR